MAATLYKIFPFSSGVNYKKFEISRVSTRNYYATQDNVNQNPNSVFSYVPFQWSREDDKVTMFYTKTGSGPEITQGSLISINGTNTSINYTGMVLDAQPYYIQYVNPGYTTGISLIGGSITTIGNPCWTTGFFFAPAYSSNLDLKTRVIESKFGDGYSQKQRDGINSNTASISLVFDNRTDRESRAILNYIEDKGGVDAFPLLLPITTLYNDPNQKFRLTDPKLNSLSYNLNSISVTATQSFDP